MPCLGAAQRRALAEQGFVLIPGALAPDTVARLRRAFDTATDADGGTQHVTITADTPEAAAWAALREHPLLNECAAQVLERSYRVGAPHGRNPRRGFGQQGLHADWPPRSRGEPFHVVTSIWLLDDFTADNGATRIVPGSHLMLALPKPLSQPLSRHPHERVVVGPAGAALVFNGHLWHSGTRNVSGAPRRAVQLLVHAKEHRESGRVV